MCIRDRPPARGFLMDALKEIFNSPSADELYLARQVKNMKNEDESVVAKAAAELKGMSDDLPGAGKNAGMIGNDRRNMAKNGAVGVSVQLMVNSDDYMVMMHCSKILRNLSCEPECCEQMVKSNVAAKIMGHFEAEAETPGFSVKKTAGIDPLKKLHKNLKVLFDNLGVDAVYDEASCRYVEPGQEGVVRSSVSTGYMHHWSTDPYQNN
eukprot:TRINITY_DN2017_c0_g2_i1.p1 TRINITY_DN2017_c0_g2~~TRINITY_DN2017_c0_g2_i1.p1  ORF type:complete len:209 (+),score=70.87 TRINITY_DN2017_c0_g2_i1:187-813(+)